MKQTFFIKACIIFMSVPTKAQMTSVKDTMMFMAPATQKFMSTTVFLDAAINSVNTFNSMIKKENYRNRFLEISGGKRISQFNKDNPIDALTNSLYTLVDKKNYMKLYENWFGKIEYHNRFENGFRIRLDAVFEDRLPVHLLLKVKERYNDKSITGVTEILGEDGLTYFVSLQDAKSLWTVTLANEEFVQVKKWKKR